MKWVFWGLPAFITFAFSSSLIALPPPGLQSLTPSSTYQDWNDYPHVPLRLGACAQGIANYTLFDAFPKRPTAYAIIISKHDSWRNREHAYFTQENESEGKWSFIVQGGLPLRVGTNSWNGQIGRGDWATFHYRINGGETLRAGVSHIEGRPATLSFTKAIPHRSALVDFWIFTHEPRARDHATVDDKGNPFALQILSPDVPRSTVVFDYAWKETADSELRRGGILEVVYDPRRSLDTLFKPRRAVFDWETWATVRFHRQDGKITTLRTRIISGKTQSPVIPIREFNVRNRLGHFPIPLDAVRAQIWFETLTNVEENTGKVWNYDSRYSQDFWFNVR